MNVVHLTDSPFFGGPERQMLGLAITLPPTARTTVLCFRNNGSSAPFVDRLAAAGVTARTLDHANPRFFLMVGDIVRELRAESANLLVCHGYKADVLGLIAALHLGLPIISVSRGWTAHTWKVRFNERLDRVVLRFMDRVACVSEAQAAKVRHAGVRAERVRVIHNSIDTRRFAVVGRGHEALQSLFPTAREQIVIGVGRLSPEKGFDQLIEAAALVVPHYPDVGFVLVGDGPERERLARLISNANLQDRFILSGFRSDVDALIPGANILAQSSHTEGLPNVVLEACAAGIPVVATDVGGTREVIRDGYNGFLVPAGKPEALAARLLDLLRSPDRRRSMGMSGRQVVADEFSFERQSAEYMALFDEVTTACRSRVTRAIPQTTTGGSVA